MKVPEYIKKSIRLAGKHNVIAAKNNDIIRKWIDDNKIDDMGLEDYLIDSIEKGVDGSEGLIEYIEEIQ
jgi:hypothetical protein